MSLETNLNPLSDQRDMPEDISIIDSLDSEEQEKESKIAVQTECLSVYFNERPAIEDINLKIRKNRVTAVIGPSGCGKSTLLRSLNLMHEMTPKSKVVGSIKIHGKDITESNAVDVRKNVGMVFRNLIRFLQCRYLKM